MDLKEVQISEIKNLNSIWVFTTDSIFNNKSNKYVGVKVVFDKTRVLEFNYTDKYFQTFIKKVLERYHKEKDKRKIVLLGDLTKKLINESSFAVLENNETKGQQEVGLPSFNSSDNEIKKEEPYLKQAVAMILKVYKNYEVLEVNNIDGFNNRYLVTFYIGSVKKQIPIVATKIDEGLIDFRVSKLDSSSVGISGTIKSSGANVEIEWQSKDEEVKGSIKYDAQNNIAERKVVSALQTIIYDENKDTLLEEDMELIKFYFDLCGIKVPSHILKTSNNSFLLSDEESLIENEDELMYSNIGARLNTSKDEVRLRYHLKNCFSKYNNQISSVLDEEIEEITFRKIDLDGKKVILVEKKYSRSSMDDTFAHEVIEVNSDVDMQKPFEIKEKYTVDKEIKTLEHAKFYIKQRRSK